MRWGLSYPLSMIEAIVGRQVFDSRGNPTVEVEVLTENGGLGRASVPSGASTGRFEAVELRDGGKAFGGMGVARAVSNVNDVITPALVGEDCMDQILVDRILLELDGTDNKSNLGANAMLGVSMAVARAAADELGLELFKYIGGAGAHLLPVPLMNVLNGGAHADNNLDVQEFMIVPQGAASFSEAMQMGSEIYWSLKKILKARGLATAVGDEGGFAPDLDGDEQALGLLTEAIEASGYQPGTEVSLALDLAASQWLDDGRYRLGGQEHDVESLVEMYGGWLDRYPIISMEDALDEDDWEGWKSLTGALGQRVQIVGDDLFVTNPERLQRGIRSGTANSILVKVNQIGTLTETSETVYLALTSGLSAVLSHRSGETEDSTIADLAVAWGAGQIKAGAPARSERLAKYNQLLRIEESLGESARYAGAQSFRGGGGDSTWRDVV